MRIILVRHGEVLRHIDNPSLTKIGNKQVPYLAKKLKSFKIDVIYSSDLKRARQTAMIIGKLLKQKVIFDSSLREIPDEIIETSPSNWKKRKHDLKGIKQVKKFLNELQKNHREQTVLLVGHAKTNRLIVSILTKINPRSLLFFNQGHCNIALLDYGERYVSDFRKKIYGWKVKLWNSQEHLPKNLRTGVNKER